MHQGNCASVGEVQEWWGFVREEEWELDREVQIDTVPKPMS